MKQPLLLCTVLACLSVLAQAESIVFPADSGVVDVTQPPYNAVGDGKTDCTQALQRALDDHPSQRAIIYLPNGIYLVSDTIRWPAGSGGGTHKRTTLQGQSEASTVILLADKSAGFEDPSKPKGIVWTGPKPAQRFGNEIRNITIDAGKGNPGAAAVQFNTSNQGSMRNVTLRTSDSGAIGLDLRFTDEIGPCLLRDITVLGFDTGVWCAHSANSMTFERLRLQGQKHLAFRNRSQIVNIRGFQSSNSVPAVFIEGKSSVVTLIDADIRGVGEAANLTAITNESCFFLRNAKISGYAAPIENKNGNQMPLPATPTISEWVSHPILSLFPSPARSLNLPVKETPEPTWDPLDQWIAPTGIDRTSKDKSRNDAPAIQAAIDSGKPTVYLPKGTYQIAGDIILRPSLRRLIGCGAKLEGKGRILLTEDSPSPVMIERIEISYSKIPIMHGARRTLILSGMVTADYVGQGMGELFLDDVVGGFYQIKQQQMWARQLNIEPSGTHLSNHGGTIWILGLKTERGGVLVETKRGRTEILGCHNYSTTGPKTTPVFTVEDGALSVTMGETNFNKNPYIAIVSEKRGALVRTLWKDEVPSRGGAAMFPLFVAYQGTGELTKPIQRSKPPLTLPTPAPKEQTAPDKKTTP